MKTIRAKPEIKFSMYLIQASQKCRSNRHFGIRSDTEVTSVRSVIRELKFIDRVNSEKFQGFNFQAWIVVFDEKITKMITRVSSRIFTNTP